MEATARQLAAKPADYLGWWVGLAVGCQVGFWGTVAYILLVQWGHPHLNFTTADYVAAAWLALQLVLAAAGFVRWGFSLWQRRWWRALTWGLLNGLNLGLFLMAYAFGAIVLIGAPSVGDPPASEREELDRSLNFAPARPRLTEATPKLISRLSFYSIL